MNKEIRELNFEEMEQVNGGWNWENFGLGALVGGAMGGVIVGTAALVASGPVGWCILGGAAVGAAAMGTCGGLEIIH
jgi:hypothetical protein